MQKQINILFIAGTLLTLTTMSCRNSTSKQTEGNDSSGGATVASVQVTSSILIGNRMKDKFAGRYDNIGDYAEGFIPVDKDGKSTFVDTSGKELMPLQFDRVGGFTNGYSFVERDGTVGLIDTKGQEVFPFRKDWEYIGPVEDGWASVKIQAKK